jgi:hypothetical protein
LRDTSGGEKLNGMAIDTRVEAPRDFSRGHA